MKLLVRTLGSPVPQEVPCTASSTLGDVLEALAAGNDDIDAQQDRHKLVYRGRVLHDITAKLCDVVADGDVLVLLPRRSVAPRPPPPPEPSRGPTLREINAAIRDDLAAQGPGRLEAAEAAARRAGGGGAAGFGGGALPDAQALEQALLSGEMGALRAYLDQLQEALRGAGGIPAAGAGGDAQADAGDLPLTAALDLMLGLGVGEGGQAAAHQHDEEEEEEEEHEEEGFEEEEETEGEEEDEEYTDEEEDYEEEGASEEDEEEHGGELEPPQVPDPDSRLLAELMEMGFAEPLCRNALLMGRNRFEPALEWLLEHVEDPAAAEPLSDAQLARLYGRGPRRAGPPVDQGALQMLQEMGFDRHQAEQALRTFNNSLNAATGWLLNLGALAAAAPEPAGGGAQPAEAGQPAAAAPQQAEAEDGSDGTQSMHSSDSGDASSNEDDSDGEDGQPAGQEEVPGLASDGGSSSGSDEDEEQRRPAAQAPVQAAAQAAQGRQPALRQQGEDGPPGLDSDGGSSYDALD